MDNTFDSEEDSAEPAAAASSSSKNISAIKKIQKLGFPFETQDPFLFCVHHEDFYPKGSDSMGVPSDSLKGRMIGQDFQIKDGFRMYHGTNGIPGFPAHPHRGFETVTVVRKGFVDHSDSLGGAGRYGNGDTQWMTASSGVQHCEMFPLLNKDSENTLELFQIWLNLPKANKFSEPHYKMLWKDSIPIYQNSDENGRKTIIEVISGQLGDKIAPRPPPDSWAYPKDNDVAIWNIEMDPLAKWTLPKASPDINRTLYFFKGDTLKIDDTLIKNYHSAQVLSEKTLSIENGKEKGHILLLQGKPIKEPVVQHGPFVMNTPGEIRQAYSEYQKTRFGGWPWPTSDHVHPRSKGRFALYTNGTEEIPDSETSPEP